MKKKQTIWFPRKLKIQKFSRNFKCKLTCRYFHEEITFSLYTIKFKVFSLYCINYTKRCEKY